MAVYVDNMMVKKGRLIFSHMVADTEDELHEMADKIGVDRKWHQKKGTYLSHYDVCQSKKKLAILNGAEEITQTQLGKILINKRKAIKGGII